MKRTIKAWVSWPFQGSFWVGQDCRTVQRHKPYDPSIEVTITYDDGKPAKRRKRGGK